MRGVHKRNASRIAHTTQAIGVTLVAWGFTDPVARSWLARLDVLRTHASNMQNDVTSIIQQTQRLCESGRRAEALQVAADTRRHFVEFTNEVEDIVAHLQRRGLKAYGLESITGSVDKMRTDLDLLTKILS